jgi:hypothetical protein
MKFSIVFDNSGDSLVFDALSLETYSIIEYYVNQLELNHTNKFNSTQQNIHLTVSAFDQAINKSNSLIGDFTEMPIPVNTFEDYLDQSFLNQVHADWVQSQDRVYSILERSRSGNESVRLIARQLHEKFSQDQIYLRDVLDKLELVEMYSDINLKLHAVERLLKCIKFKTDTWIEFDNPFDKSFLTNSVCNFRISFNHLGRTLYNKWQNFDTALEYNDENSFNQLLGFVDIGVARPQTIGLSPEYTEWCRQKNREPIGEFLNIGNILELDKKLNECRIVLYRNIHSGNSFSIKLNKG